MSSSNSVASPAQIKTYFLMFSAFILGFAFPTSIALINIAYGLVIISIIVNHDFSRATALVKSPLFYLPLIMFLFMLASLFYADNEFGKTMLSKYKKLLYIFPVALFFLQDRRLARIALKGFVIANTIVLILSLLGWLNWFQILKISPDNPTVFHLHITQNFFMALTCLIWLVMIFKTSGWQRIVYSILLLLGVFDILFLVNGRTGYVAVAAGLGIWLWMVLNNKQRIILAVAGIVGIIFISIVPNKVQDRMLLGVSEVQRCTTALESHGDVATDCRTSMGLRTEFAYKAIELIKRSPVIGVGVGGFDYYSDDNYFHHVNPHNEYLMQTLQSGVIGLGIFLLWVFFMYRAASLLSGVAKPFFISIITVYMVGSLFNSFVLDAYEGQLLMTVIAYLAAEMTLRRSDKITQVIR